MQLAETQFYKWPLEAIQTQSLVVDLYSTVFYSFCVSRWENLNWNYRNGQENHKYLNIFVARQRKLNVLKIRWVIIAKNTFIKLQSSNLSTKKKKEGIFECLVLVLLIISSCQASAQYPQLTENGWKHSNHIKSAIDLKMYKPLISKTILWSSN